MAPNTIILKGSPPQFEAVPAAAITPGHLVELTSSGTVQKHSTAGGQAPAMFAIENALEGEEISDDYGTSDICQYVHARPGDEIYAYLNSGENVSIGDFLESAGDGTLQATTSGTEPGSVLAMALEAVNLSASAAVDTRIKVRII